MFLAEWWNGMSLVSQVFTCIALPATLVLLIQTIMMFIGLDGNAEGSADSPSGDIPDDIPDMPEFDGGDDVFPDDGLLPEGDPDVSGAVGLKIFTLRGIIAFFVVFGWSGVVFDGSGAPLYMTVPLAFASGFAMMLVLALLFRSLMKLRNDGNADNKNALGVSGKVYLTIPPARSGEGKVNIMLQGSYVERNAVTDEAKAIPTGTEIVVIGVSGQTELVVKRK